MGEFTPDKHLAPSFGLTYSWAILLRFLGVCCCSIVEPFHGSEVMMAVAPKPRLSKPKGTRFVLRPYRRIPTWLVLYYLSGECVGKGVVTNLSQSGMRIQGDHAVEPGLDLALRVTFADDGPTIEIERATVRWVDGYDFGLDLCPRQSVSREAHRPFTERADSCPSDARLKGCSLAGLPSAFATNRHE